MTRPTMAISCHHVARQRDLVARRITAVTSIARGADDPGKADRRAADTARHAEPSVMTLSERPAV